MLLRLLPAFLLVQSLGAGGQVTFSGRVSHGQEFSRPIGGGLWFCLFPEPDANGGGWRIAVGQSRDSTGHDLVAVATPPMYGVNQREIEGWHFDPGVNAPKRIRDFSFVVTDRAWAQLMSDLNSYSDAGKMLREQEKLARGHGTLTITKMHRHESLGGKSVFDWMQFHVVIVINDRQAGVLWNFRARL
ncbi:MAG: hypothetical protein ACLQPN_09315 [Bryobacteraceae bacterium]